MNILKKFNKIAGNCGQTFVRNGLENVYNRQTRFLPKTAKIWLNPETVGAAQAELYCVLENQGSRLESIIN